MQFANGKPKQGIEPMQNAGEAAKSERNDVSTLDVREFVPQNGFQFRLGPGCAVGRQDDAGAKKSANEWHPPTVINPQANVMQVEFGALRLKRVDYKWLRRWLCPAD
jgi:hypothetical protein